MGDAPKHYDGMSAIPHSADWVRDIVANLPPLTPATHAIPADSVVAEAMRLVDDGDRQALYGDPAVTFAMIADTWSALLRGKLAPGAAITARDVGVMMIGFKCVRDMRTPKRDNLVDIVGYVRTTERATQ